MSFFRFCDVFLNDIMSNNGIVYVPAPASKKIITGILREKFGYNGVLVTDAVEMGAICDYFDTKLDMYAAIY